MFPTHVGIARARRTATPAPTYVPYACGDCATVGLWACLRMACSLRMWGLRAGACPGRNAVRMFPTHVGIARQPCAYRMSRHYVPYACGDCAATGRRRRPACRCSLRMWGLRDRRAVGMPTYGMFPTHVGIARSRRPPRRSRPHVPYACGDCADWAGRGHGHQECSLRMWGLRGMRAGRIYLASMFPTHVGIARSRRGRAGPTRHVPYACGDCAHDGQPPVPRLQCSLRMWGLRDMAATPPVPPKMFPTHVGIARK